MILYVLEINNNKNIRNYYSFDIDSGKDFDYRARVSSNAFIFNTKKYNWKKDGTIFVGKDTLELSLDYYYKTNNPDIMHFNSIWEFYKYIGYDYKKKKYLK